MYFKDSTRAHYVYRLFDQKMALLYVGCSFNPLQRIMAHKSKPWFGKIHKITLTEFPSQCEAVVSEELAIRTESPRHNVNGFHRPKREPPQICQQCGGTGIEIDHEELRKKREAAGLTLKNVSSKMAISFGYLGDLERGRKPWNDFLKKSFLAALK